MSEPFLPPKVLRIDEEGYWQVGDLRVQDNAWARELFTHLYIDNGALWTQHEGENLLVEAFDQPLVIQRVSRQKEARESHQQIWILLGTHGYKDQITLQPQALSLFLDEWDRFLGITDRGLPFVLSRAAQADFFNQLDDYDDTAIFLGDQRCELKPWLEVTPDTLKKNFWSEKYKNYEAHGEKPGWELEAPHSAIVDSLAQLKLNKSRILVLGCGSGHDAAALAQAGHFVTAVDLSPEAIARAKKLYGSDNSSVERLQFVCSDAFSWAQSHPQEFDVVFEHTFFCALSPEKRDDIFQLWRRVLVENGHLLGVFMVSQSRTGPPFGGSEWELRQRLKKYNFRNLYWTRWRKTERRLGKELIVYAQKLNSLS